MQFFRWIRSWAIRHHFGFIALFAWIRFPGMSAIVPGALPFNCTEMSGREIDIFLSIAAVLNRLLQKRPESLAKIGKIDPVLRTFRSGNARLDLAKI